MIEGIEIDGVHSYYRYGLRMLKRSVGSAPKDDCTERVPFSNVTYDFSSVYGKSYGERTLSYQFEFMCFDRKKAQDRVAAVLEWLHWTDRKNLHDDLMPDYYFEVREPDVKWSERHGIYTFSMTFMANPEIVPNNGYTAKSSNFPDVTKDGKIDSSDSSAIMTAYSNLSAEQDSGLTEEQEKAADANMDGKIDSSDASLVLGFYSAISTGQYEGTPEGWTKYLNDFYGRRNGVI